MEASVSFAVFLTSWLWSFGFDLVASLSAANSMTDIQRSGLWPHLSSVLWAPRRVIIAALVAFRFGIAVSCASTGILLAVAYHVWSSSEEMLALKFRLALMMWFIIAREVSIFVAALLTSYSSILWPFICIFGPMEILFHFSGPRVNYFRPIIVGWWLFASVIALCFDSAPNTVIYCSLSLILITFATRILKLKSFSSILQHVWLFIFHGAPLALHVIWAYVRHQMLFAMSLFVLCFRIAFDDEISFSNSLILVLCLWYSVGLIFIARRLLRRNKERRNLFRRFSSPPQVEQNRVAIVGFGTAGILVAKELQSRNQKITIFEASESLGGVWARQGDARRVHTETLSTSSVENTAFMDFEFDCLSDDGLNHIFSAPQWIEYLSRLVESFKLEQFARFNCRVVRVEKTSNALWNVSFENGCNGDLICEEFDFVSICCGLVAEPKLPPVAENCPIISLHSSQFESVSNSWYRDENVVIVGLGETGSDLASIIAPSARSCHVLLPGAVYSLPRLILDAPADWVGEFRGIYDSPFFGFEGKIIPASIYTTALAHIISGAPTCSKAVEMGIEMDWQFIKNHMLLYFGPARFEARVPTKSCAVFGAMRQSQCVVHPCTISSLEPNAVILENESRLPATRIVWATGFGPGTFPFLNFDPESVVDRYFGTFHPSEPKISFIGYTRGIIGSIPFTMQFQAKWFAMIVSGNDSLPNEFEMRASIARERELYDLRPAALNRVAPSQATFLTGDYIAASKLGIDPDLVSIFFQSPLAWYTVMFSCISPHHYANRDNLYRFVYKCAPWKSATTFSYFLANVALILMRPFMAAMRAMNQLFGSDNDPLLASSFEHAF